MIQRINCLEFSPDDKFVFFGRLDKWFSVERGCVEDFHQFSENPGHHDWGRIVSNGQHIVVKRSHFFRSTGDLSNEKVYRRPTLSLGCKGDLRGPR